MIRSLRILMQATRSMAYTRCLKTSKPIVSAVVVKLPASYRVHRSGLDRALAISTQLA